MTPIESAINDLEGAKKHYLQDLDVMSEEQLLGSASETARKPVDFTFEVGLLHRRIAARIMGTEPPPTPEGDWWVAPSELVGKAAITEYIASSCDALIDAAKSLGPVGGDKLVGPEGNQRPAYAMISFAAMHTMYHDAQLNYIQSLSGDLAVHWN